MKVIESVEKMKMYSRVLKKDGKMIGFVPTMGYLHGGHESLIRVAKKQSDVVVISVFVNPLQFGPKEDYAKYPRDMKHDEDIAKENGVDVIFYPSEGEMYPEGYCTYVKMKGLTDNLCGASRPGHFDGVATVVTKLFEIVKPDIAYFGQKDAQQNAVIKKLVSDLNMDVMIKVLPTVREETGLAVSSRNVYLKGKEKEDAAVLSKALKNAADLFNSGERNTGRIVSRMEGIVKEKDTARIDYIRIVNRESLEDIKVIHDKALVAMAVYIGRTRLIDNITLGVDEKNEQI